MKLTKSPKVTEQSLILFHEQYCTDIMQYQSPQSFRSLDPWFMNSILTLNISIPNFHKCMNKGFENNVKKEENASNQHFLLFPLCFLICQRAKTIYNKVKFVVCRCFESLRSVKFVV